MSHTTLIPATELVKHLDKPDWEYTPPGLRMAAGTDKFIEDGPRLQKQFSRLRAT